MFNLHGGLVDAKRLAKLILSVQKRTLTSTFCWSFTISHDNNTVGKLKGFSESGNPTFTYSSSQSVHNFMNHLQNKSADFMRQIVYLQCVDSCKTGITQLERSKMHSAVP